MHSNQNLQKQIVNHGILFSCFLHGVERRKAEQSKILKISAAVFFEECREERIFLLFLGSLKESQNDLNAQQMASGFIGENGER